MGLLESQVSSLSLNLVQANNLYSPFRFNFIFLGRLLNLSDSFPAGLTQLLLKWHLGIGLELPCPHSPRDPGPCVAVSRVLRAGLVSSSDVLLACVPDICDCWHVSYSFLACSGARHLLLLSRSLYGSCGHRRILSFCYIFYLLLTGFVHSCCHLFMSSLGVHCLRGCWLCLAVSLPC